MALVRSGPLTRAQQEWFADIGADEGMPWSYQSNFCAVVSCEGAPIGHTVTTIRDLLNRHEGLRSLICRTSAGDRGQDVFDVDDRIADVIRIVAEGAAADDAIADAARTSFRPHQQWPILMVLATASGTVTRIGIVVDHAAVDGWGMRVLCADLRRMLRSTATDTGAAVEQPVDSALWEASPDGERHRERARQYWRRQYGDLVTALGGWTPPGGSAPPAGSAPSRGGAVVAPALRTRWLASAIAARAADRIAATHGVPASAAYLLSFGAAISAVEGATAASVSMLTANRLSAGAQASVRKAVMPVPVLVSGTGGYRERLSACATQQLHGHRFANLDPATAGTAATDLLGDLRGSGVAGARFNFIDNSIVGSAANSRSLGHEAIPFTDPSIQETVNAEPDRPGGSRYILNIQHRSRGALLTLACHTDTAWAPVAERMLRHIVDQLIWAAAGADGPLPRW